MKKRNIQNRTGYPSLELNHAGCLNLHSSCAERQWLIESQAHFTRSTRSSEVTPKSDFFQNTYPDVIHNETPREGIVRLTSNSGGLKPETIRDHFSKRLKIRSSHCSKASEVHLNEKWIQENHELQQLVIELKKKLSLQAQPGKKQHQSQSCWDLTWGY